MSRKSREALAESRRIPWHVVCLAALLALITFTAFAPAFANKFVAFDDYSAIVENPDFNPPEWGKFKRFWTERVPDLYTPVMWTLWGLISFSARTETPRGAVNWDPSAFHALNIVAHAAAAVFALLVLRRLVKSDRAAFVGALLFALHPIQTEAVAWAAAMKTPLSGMLSLWALWYYLKFSDRRGRVYYALATVLFVLALMTKATVVVLPVIVAFMEILLRNRRARDVLPSMLPWLALALFFGWLNAGGQTADDVMRPAFLQRILLSVNSIGFYLFKLAAPFPLLPDYSRTPANVLSGGGSLWIACVPAIVLFGAALAFRRTAPWITVAAAIFVLGVITTVGIIPYDYQIYTTVADRYAYLSMFGPALAVACVLARSAPPLKRRRQTIIATCLLIACAALTFIQCRRWHDSQTLFQFTLRHNGASLAAYRSLTFDAYSNRRPSEALDVAQKGLTTRPGDVILLQLVGQISARQGRFDEAIAALQQAASKGSGREQRLNDLGVALLQAKRFPEAQAAFAEAIRVNEAFGPAYEGLGIAYGTMGDWELAVENLSQAVDLDPNLPNAAKLLPEARAMRDKARANGASQPATVPATAPTPAVRSSL